MRPTSRAVALVVASAVSMVWSACTRDAPSPESTRVTDSAGIRVVTNLSGSIEAAESWSLSAGPVVDIASGADPEVALFRLTAVVPVDDGRVAVGVNRPPRVLVFERDGTLVATLGREGEGPGEFASIASVVPLGADSLAVWDDVRRRISVYTGDGRFAREVDLGELALPTPLAVGNTATPAAFTRLLPSGPGAFVLFQVGAFGPGEGVRRVEAPAWRITPAGDTLARLGPFPGLETYQSDRTGLSPYVFGADTDGATVGDTLVVGTGEAPELRFYGPTGALHRIVRWPDHERTLGGPLVAAWNGWLDERLADRSPQESEGIRGVLDAIPRPERFPAYDDLVVADTGDLWVGAYPGQLGLFGLLGGPPRLPERRWLVLAPGGAVVASVHTPEGFRPLAVREGRVWGVFTDELDVESVRAYEIAGG